MYALTARAHPYPQRPELADPSWLDRFSERMRSALLARVRLAPSRLAAFAARVEREDPGWQTKDRADALEAVRAVRTRLRRDGFLNPALAARALALTRHAAEATMGLRAHPNQIMGAWVLLNRQAAEIDTGEGKTLTAALAAACAALAGLRVHVITVNDYLAKRDAEALAPYFEMLGLSVAAVAEDMDATQKRAVYAHDVVYGANKVIVFDYLRDRIGMAERMRPYALALDRLAGANRTTLLPGLQFAIVDEADSVFVDEARTPLVISAERRDQSLDAHLQRAIELARKFVENDDFDLVEGARVARLTDEGRRRLAELTEGWDGQWAGPVGREEAALQALTALHCFRRDTDYIVRDDKVMIVDEHTGRVMPDRSWERGLHQLIEIKEGLEPGPIKETIARLSYQTFFRRYVNLSGMSGTCREVAGELGEVYSLGVVRLAPHRRSRRRRLPVRIFASAEARWQAVAREIARCHARGQPVLVGTRAIVGSEQLSTRLVREGIRHRVLNAKQDADEAGIVATAGESGQVTIATNMAGRGTDIKLGAGVAELGGLHVILTEGHDNARVDRQLAGRCARQGDPGSWQAMLSLEDEVALRLPRVIRQALVLWLARMPRSRVAQRVAAVAYRGAQALVSRNHSALRRRLMRADEHTRRALSFSGSPE